MAELSIKRLKLGDVAYSLSRLVPHTGLSGTQRTGSLFSSTSGLHAVEVIHTKGMIITSAPASRIA